MQNNILNELHASIEYFSGVYSQKYKVDKCDLYQEGFLAASEALDKFDANKSKLITFASPYIKYKMLKFCNSQRKKVKYYPNEELDVSLVEDSINESSIDYLKIDEVYKKILHDYIVDEVPLKEIMVKYNITDGAARKIIKAGLRAYQISCKQ